MKVGSTVKYNLTGADSEGDFQQVRRFREFAALSEALAKNWPGVYVPSIPEKQLQNKDEAFVEERRQLLERFLKEIAKLDYILESEEFKIFSRGTGEVDKALSNMPK